MILFCFFVTRGRSIWRVGDGTRGEELGVNLKGRVAQIGSFEKKIVQKVAMVC